MPGGNLSLLNRVFGRQPSRNEYSLLISKALSDSGAEVLRYDEELFSIHLKSGSTIFLHNGYANYCAADNSTRKTVLKNFVSSLTPKPVPSDFASARPYLIPIIRNASHYALAELQSRMNGDGNFGYQKTLQRLTDDLVVGLVYDTEHNMTHINQSTFDPWGIDFSEAVKISQDNLRDRTDPNKLVEHAPGLFAGQWSDSYESSRLLLTDYVHRLPLSGEPVAFIPSRDQFWITGSENIDGLEAMAKFGQQNHFGAYPLSPHLFLLRDRQWTIFTPESKPLCDSLLSIHRQRQALDYSQQKQYLEVIHQKENIDVFVTTFSVYQETATKREGSYCVWSNGVDSLLPRTEKIMLIADIQTKTHVLVAWEAAQSIVGHLMEKQAEFIPERYRVRSFPGEQEFAELRQSAGA